MPAFSKWLRLVLVLLAVGLIPVRSAELASTNEVIEPIRPAPLSVEKVDESRPGIPNAYRIYATSGTNRFAFLLPARFRMELVRQDKILLVAPDEVTFVSVRIVDAVVRKTVPPESVKTMVLREYNQGEIEEEFTLHAADSHGPAVEFRWIGPGGYSMKGRSGLVPSSIGVLEFLAVGPQSGMEEARWALNTVLATFRASAEGKLQVSPLSNRF